MRVATLSRHMDDELRRTAQVVYCANGVFHPITSIDPSGDIRPMIADDPKQWTKPEAKPAKLTRLEWIAKRLAEGLIG